MWMILFNSAFRIEEMGPRQFDHFPRVGPRALGDAAGMRTWGSGMSWVLFLRSTALPLIPTHTQSPLLHGVILYSS